jgi:hypothetical protein
MNNSQFYFTRKEQSPLQIEGQEPKFKEYKDSFSLDIVLLSIETPTGRTVVLNHVHERNEEIPVKNHKGKVTAVRNQRGMYQTEISLNQEDSERFYKLTNIE